MPDLMNTEILLEAYRARIDTLESEIENQAAIIQRLQSDTSAKGGVRKSRSRTLRALDIHFPSIFPL